MTEEPKPKGSAPIPVNRKPYEWTDGDKLARYAKTLVGTPFKWGGDDPGKDGGFDVAGLINHVFASAGMKVGSTTTQQIAHGTVTTLGKIVPGDVIFFDPQKSGLPDGGGIYAGGGLMVTTTQKTGVTIMRVSQGGKILDVRSYGAKSKHPLAPTWNPANVPQRKSLAVGFPPKPAPLHRGEPKDV